MNASFHSWFEDREGAKYSVCLRSSTVRGQLPLCPPGSDTTDDVMFMICGGVSVFREDTQSVAQRHTYVGTTGLQRGQRQPGQTQTRQRVRIREYYVTSSGQYDVTNRACYL